MSPLLACRPLRMPLLASSTVCSNQGSASHHAGHAIRAFGSLARNRVSGMRQQLLLAAPASMPQSKTSLHSASRSQTSLHCASPRSRLSHPSDPVWQCVGMNRASHKTVAFHMPRPCNSPHVPASACNQGLILSRNLEATKRGFGSSPRVCMPGQQQADAGPPQGWLDNPNSEFLVRFDGGARGNPGIGASAAVIWRDGTMLWRGSFLHHECTINQAEYFGLILGLRAASVLGAKKLRAESASLLVINQLKGSWQCKHEGLRDLYDKARSMVEGFEAVELGHVLRQQNLEVDELVSKAMEEHANTNEIYDGSEGWLWVEMDQEAADKHHEDSLRGSRAGAARATGSGSEVEVRRRRVQVLDASGYFAAYHLVQ